MFVFPRPNYVACADCGACVPWSEKDEHNCEEDKWLEYQLVCLRPQIAAFPFNFGEWLQTNKGQFEVFYAAQHRPKSESGYSAD